MSINRKQQRFVEEYLIDLNATQAAIRAGYSAKWAASNIDKILKNTGIQLAIADAQKKRSERTEITQDRVLTELAKIGFADIRKSVKWGPNLGIVETDDGMLMTNGVLLVDSESIDDDTAASISEISQTAQGIKIKLHDKRAALVDIGRHLGMFNDKLQLQGDRDKPIQVNATVESAKGWLSEIISGINGTAEKSN